MKKAILLVMVMVFSMTSVNVMAQAAPGAAAKVEKSGKPADKKAKYTLQDLEGLTEEQILALLKGLEIDDILYYLRMVVQGGSRELLVNMIGAMNSVMSTMEPKAAMELAQKAAAENQELSYGVGKDGKPLVYVTVANENMNNLINTTTNQQTEIESGKDVISGAGSL